MAPADTVGLNCTAEVAALSLALAGDKQAAQTQAGKVWVLTLQNPQADKLAQAGCRLETSQKSKPKWHLAQNQRA